MQNIATDQAIIAATARAEAHAPFLATALLREPELAPGDLNRPDWTERATCSICAST